MMMGALGYPASYVKANIRFRSRAVVQSVGLEPKLPKLLNVDVSPSDPSVS